MEIQISIIAIARLLSAFCAGMESAFLSSNKLRLEIERKQSKTYDHIASLFLKAPGQYISTILVGNNIALVIYSIFMSSLYVSITGSSNYALETLISTLIIIFTSEFLPKAVVKANPNFYLRHFAIPLYGFYIIFYPLSRFATMLSTLLLRLMGKRVTPTPQTAEFGKVDLATLVEEAAGGEESDEEEKEDNDQRIRLFQNALDFSEQRVRDCMVPRTDIEALEVSSSVDDLRHPVGAVEESVGQGLAHGVVLAADVVGPGKIAGEALGHSLDPLRTEGGEAASEGGRLDNGAELVNAVDDALAHGAQHLGLEAVGTAGHEAVAGLEVQVVAAVGRLLA